LINITAIKLARHRWGDSVFWYNAISEKLKISCGQRTLWCSAMSLNHKMLVLKTAGGMAGMLPVGGEQMKSAVELASTICELVKVNLVPSCRFSFESDILKLLDCAEK
jgi:hypothetical protein